MQSGGTGNGRASAVPGGIRSALAGVATSHVRKPERLWNGPAGKPRSMRYQRGETEDAVKVPGSPFRSAATALARHNWQRLLPLLLPVAFALVLSILHSGLRRTLLRMLARAGVAGEPVLPPEGIAVPRPGEPLTLAVVGDFGRCHKQDADCESQKAVARLVDSWSPDYIVTTGDNNYPRGEASTMAANLVPYRKYIEAGRFLAVLGNHDWDCGGLPRPYLDQFCLPGNGRYYALNLNGLGIWVLDSDEREPDGIRPDSVQGRWLRDGLVGSDTSINLVFLHHPPYSSGHHGSSKHTRWPFAAWGADALFAGHEHSYERLEMDGIAHFVNGSGGAGLRGFGRPLPGTRVRYATGHGAQRILFDGRTATIEFWSVHGHMVDCVRLHSSRRAELPAPIAAS